MFRFASCLTVIVPGVAMLATSSYADVFNMGLGLTSFEMVTVGNPGNANDPETGYGGVAEAYLIGKYEVTTAQYTEFLNAVGGVDIYGLYNTYMWSHINGCRIDRFDGAGTTADPYKYRVASDRANRPVNFVSWGDAARFSNWLHNGQPTGAQNDSSTEDGSYDLHGATTAQDLVAATRQSDATWVLPTVGEWSKAAYHKNDGVTGNYWDYPTGTDAAPNNGNPSGDTGNTANFYDGDYTIGSPYWTTPVGYFGLSGSPYGTFDQGGNMWEWNESFVAGTKCDLQGGASRDGREPLHASFQSFWVIRDNELADAGFRVAIPEPGSITLLLFAALGLLAYGWRRRRRNGMFRLTSCLAVLIGLVLGSASAVQAEQIVLLAGEVDGFALPPEPATPSSDLIRINWMPGDPQDFDIIAQVNGGRSDAMVGHTFVDLPPELVAASLELRVRAGDDPATVTDQILLAFADAATADIFEARVYLRTFAAYGGDGPGGFMPDPDPGLLQSEPWLLGDDATFTLDLADLPLADGGSLNLLPELNAHGFLDVLVIDETGADYMQLTVTPIPEPSSLVLLGMGAVGLLAYAWRKRRP